MDSGFDQKASGEIANALTTRSDSAFREPIPEPNVRFYEPVLRVSIEFADFTVDGPLRCRSFSRLVPF